MVLMRFKSRIKDSLDARMIAQHIRYSECVGIVTLPSQCQSLDSASSEPGNLPVGVAAARACVLFRAPPAVMDVGLASGLATVWNGKRTVQEGWKSTSTYHLATHP